MDTSANTASTISPKPTVMVAGGGTMGSGIALVFAMSGHKTYLASRSKGSSESALARVGDIAKSLASEGLATDDQISAINENLQAITYDQLPEIATEVDFVFESVIEDPNAKRAVYEMLGRHCRKDCILASNTSGMDVFSLCSEFLENPERLIIAHWFNPPHLMKLVEVVRGPQSSDGAVERMRALLESVGRKPAVLNSFVPGFIVNRIATVINRELYHMIDQGWITAEDAETAIRYTHGLRFGFEGPIALWDFVGLGIPMTVAKGGVLASLCNDTETLPLGEKLLAEGRMGAKTGAGALEFTDAAAYASTRSRRIVQMSKIVDAWDAEDKAAKA